MVTTKKEEYEDYYEVRIKIGELITTLKSFEDEDIYKLYKFPHIKEYDHNLHSESAVASLFTLYGEAGENLNNQFIPPELIKYFSTKKKDPDNNFVFTKGYHNEIW